jgi:hypothetical protein
MLIERIDVACPGPSSRKATSIVRVLSVRRLVKAQPDFVLHSLRHSLGRGSRIRGRMRLRL